MRSRIRRQCYYDARANDVNVEEITSSENNANILRALRDEQADNNLWRTIRLNTGESDGVIDENDENFFMRDGDDLGWLGYLIGQSQLNALVIAALPQDREQIDALIEGIARNQSIKKIIFGTDLGDAGYQELARFFRSNRVSTLGFYQMNIGRQQAHNIASTLRRMQHKSIKKVAFLQNIISEEGFGDICGELSSLSQIENFDLWGSNIGRNGCVELGSILSSWHAPNLRQLDLQDSSIDDRGLQALIAGMINCCNLEIVALSGNRSITAAGLRSLSTLFQSENCALNELDLERMNIGDDGVVLLAEGLVGNKTLEKLSFDSSGITDVGWAAFSKLLCDTSSINNTYLSNHTLQWIGISGFPEIVKAYLGWNTLYNKQDVAIMKIVVEYSDLDMESFFQWKLKFLPLVVIWFDRARQCAPENVHVVAYLQSIVTVMDRMKLASVYQFVRGMPMLVLDGYQSQTPLRRSKRRKLLNGET